MQPILVTLLTLLLGGHVEFGQNVPPDQRLQMSDAGAAFIFTVPVSSLALTVPKGDLLPANSHQDSTSPRYFHLEGKTSGLIISGWFEPEPSFRGIKPFWDGELGAMRNSKLPEPQDVSFEDIGNWKTVWYDLKAPGGYDSNIRAEWVQDGTWIDLHISLGANVPPSEIRGKLRTFLNSIQVAVR